MNDSIAAPAHHPQVPANHRMQDGRRMGDGDRITPIGLRARCTVPIRNNLFAFALPVTVGTRTRRRFT